jgi:hypothetical protein
MLSKAKIDLLTRRSPEAAAKHADGMAIEVPMLWRIDGVPADRPGLPGNL